MKPLKMLLGDNIPTRALKSGQVGSAGLELDITPEGSVVRLFADAIRSMRYDVIELPLVTYLIARDRGVAMDLLPVPVLARYPFSHLVRRADRDAAPVASLRTEAVGIRSHTVTTVIQILDVLRHDFGIGREDLRMIATEDPHFDDLPVPRNLERSRAAPDPETLLDRGVVRIAIAGARVLREGHVSVFPDPAALIRSWRERSGGGGPINHVMALRPGLAAENPRLVSELFALFLESNRIAARQSAEVRELYPIGAAACRSALAHTVRMALEQKLIAHDLDPATLIPSFLHAT